MHVIIRGDIALFVHGKATVLEQIGIRHTSDKSKHAEQSVILICLVGGQLAGLNVADDHFLQQLIAAQLFHHGIPHEEQLVVLEGFFLDGLCRAQFVSAMDDGNLTGKLGQIHGFFHSCVAAAYHKDFQIFKEVGIAGGTIGNAAAHIVLLALAADRSGISTGRNDHGLALILALSADKLFHRAFQLYAADGIRYTVAAELFALLCHTCDQAGAALFFQHLSRIVLDLIRDRDLTAVLSLFNDQRGKTSASCIQAGCQAAGAGAKNHNIINLAHCVSPFSLRMASHPIIKYYNAAEVKFLLTKAPIL